MRKLLQYCLLLLCSSFLLVAQTTTREKPASKAPDQQKDIDPLALKVLKAVTDPIRDAKAFSFKTRVMREYVGSNGQIITYFNTSHITLERPDKLRVDFKGRGQDVQLFYNSGQAVLYAPGPKLYTMFTTAKTIDGVREPDPRIKGLEVTNMALGREPRVIVEFSDWNLNPDITPETFSFNKPEGAKQIDFLHFPKPGKE